MPSRPSRLSTWAPVCSPAQYGQRGKVALAGRDPLGQTLVLGKAGISGAKGLAANLTVGFRVLIAADFARVSSSFPGLSFPGLSFPGLSFPGKGQGRRPHYVPVAERYDGSVDPGAGAIENDALGG